MVKDRFRIIKIKERELNMNNILVICGFSSSGKDRITKYISDKYKFNMIKSTTSRPMRLNESEGNPYNFITKEKFLNLIESDEFIEYRKYNTLVNNMKDIWFYGVSKNSINLIENSYIVVLDLLGLIEFKKHFGNCVKSFFIDVNETERKKRAVLSRKDFDITEWLRRYNDDLKQFPKELIEKEVDYIVENYNFHQCISKIVKILNLN